jgi:hypothetical protein
MTWLLGFDLLLSVSRSSLLVTIPFSYFHAWSAKLVQVSPSLHIYIVRSTPRAPQPLPADVGCCYGPWKTLLRLRNTDSSCPGSGSFFEGKHVAYYFVYFAAQRIRNRCRVPLPRNKARLARINSPLRTLTTTRFEKRFKRLRQGLFRSVRLHEGMQYRVLYQAIICE